MPVSNIPAELSELLEQIQQKVEALKDITKRNYEQEVSKWQ